MEIYDRVAKVVAPKKAKLKEAQSQLAETMALLNTKRAELKAVQDRLANLEKTFQEMVEKKKNLEFQVWKCINHVHIKITTFFVLQFGTVLHFKIVYLELSVRSKATSITFIPF